MLCCEVGLVIKMVSDLLGDRVVVVCLISSNVIG